MQVEDLLEGNMLEEQLSSAPVEISFFPDSTIATFDSENPEFYCLLVESSRESRSPILKGLVICSTEDPDRFRRVGVFHAIWPKACAALGYKFSHKVKISKTHGNGLKVIIQWLKAVSSSDQNETPSISPTSLKLFFEGNSMKALLAR
jgi:hypothetical protein